MPDRNTSSSAVRGLSFTAGTLLLLPTKRNRMPSRIEMFEAQICSRFWTIKKSPVDSTELGHAKSLLLTSSTTALIVVVLIDTGVEVVALVDVMVVVVLINMAAVTAGQSSKSARALFSNIATISDSADVTEVAQRAGAGLEPSSDAM